MIYSKSPYLFFRQLEQLAFLRCSIDMLLIFSLMVVLAWILGKPLLLLFDPFESVVCF